MDLANPLRSLVPSLDSATLEVLAGVESGLGTSHIQRLAGRGSRTGHQKVLDRLTEQGLVLSQPTNNGFTYRLNREHLLAAALLSAINVRRELLSRLSATVAELDPPPVHASVFGSLARGEGTTASDIDLFLVMPDNYDDDGDWDAQLQTLEEQVLAWTGNRLEALVLDQIQLMDAKVGGETVLDSIRDQGLTIYGADVEAVLPEKVLK